MSPTSPGDWRRFVLLAVCWVAAFLLVSLVLGRLSGSDSNVGLSGLLPIGGYFWVASQWWRMYFQEVARPAGRGADEPTLRRWLVRGRAIWIAAAYLSAIGQIIVSSSDGSAEDDAGSWLALLIFLPLPFGAAWLAALMGRYFADQYPIRR